jgi:PcfJ-like protein
MFNVINENDVRRSLQRDNQVLTSLLVQCAYLGLLCAPSALEEVEEYPQNPPPWLTPERFRRGGPFHRFVLTPEIQAELDKLESWLLEAIRRDEDWLKDRDENGLVRRLKNIGKLHQAMDKREKDMRRWNQVANEGRRPCPGYDEPHVETVMKLGDGFTWVKLNTAQALRWEGRMMQHCVGSDIYARALEGGVAEFYSLRDVRGRPHVTLEVCDRKIQQCSGQGNCIPGDFLPAIDALRNAKHWNRPAVEGMRRPSRRRCRLYADACLDEERTVAGNWDLKASTDVIRLPRVLKVEGTLDLSQSQNFTALPEILLVEGNLRLAGCANLRIMPRWMWVEGDIDMTNCSAVKALPVDCGLGGSLDLTGCGALRSLPAALNVEGCLILDGCTGLMHIPSSVSIGDTINIGRIAYCAVADVNRRLAGGGWLVHKRRRR